MPVYTENKPKNKNESFGNLFKLQSKNLLTELVLTSLFKEDPPYLVIYFYLWIEGWLCNKGAITDLFCGLVGPVRRSIVVCSVGCTLLLTFFTAYFFC